MRIAEGGLWWSRQTVTGCLIGTLFSFASPASPAGLGDSPAYSAPSHAPQTGDCVLADFPQAGIGPVVSSNYSLTGVQSNISLNTTDLGPGYINCYDNAYWVGMQNNDTTACGGVGQFAQDGWEAVYNAQNNTVSYQYFTEYYNEANQVGCGSHVTYNGTASGGTYEVTMQYSNCYYNGPGAYVYFYANGSLINSACSDWNEGTGELDVFTEIQGTTNNAGAIGFWWTKYCLNSAPCAPNTEPSGAAPSNNGNAEIYIGHHNVSSPSWPNWNSCDAFDFNSTTC